MILKPKELIEDCKKQIKDFTDIAVIGLSGGADSTLVTILCTLALGKRNVHGILLPLNEENPDIIKDEVVYEMFDTAVQQEIEWTNHIIGNDILGVTEESTENYTKWLANQRLRSLGYKAIYEGFDRNPYKHLEKIADTDGNGDVKANFFESTVTSYNQSSAVDGWDEI